MQLLCSNTLGFFWLQCAAADVQIMIVGNKCDLIDSREVSEIVGQEFADQHDTNFMEISVKESININEV